MSRDIDFKGNTRWHYNLITFLDLGGCENVVNASFARNILQLPIKEDDSSASKDLQQSVNGHVFSFSHFVDVQCSFKGYKERVKFFLIENLPHPFLFGYPFFKKRGAIFDLTRPNVTFKYIKGQPSISLIPTSSSEEGTISLFGANNIFCPSSTDISEEDAPANISEINIPLKKEFENKIFFRPEPIRSPLDQEIIDRNAEQLITDKFNRAFFNPKSKHNIGQVIVPRLDKNGIPVAGRERVCLDLKPVNKCLEHYEHPIPRIDDILRRAIKFKVFSEMDLDSGYHQFKISENLSDIFTFTC